MSKLYDRYLEEKNKNNDNLYLFRSGMFYIFIDEDAKKISTLTTLKLTNLNNNIVKCGFPYKCLEKYLNLFKNLNLKINIIEDRINYNSIIDKINIFINDKLKLEYNYKSRYYPNNMGINFCGYRIFETHKLLRIRSKKKIKNNIRIWNKLYINNKLNFKKILLSWNSWIGHAKNSNSYNFRIKMYNRINNCLIKNKLMV